MKILRKLLIVSTGFTLCGFFIWGLGLPAQEQGMGMQFLAFLMQLLYGSLLYDLMKSLRPIPSTDVFWKEVTALFGEAALYLLIGGAFIVVAANVFFLAYVGLLVGISIYLAIFLRLLPRLEPAYKAAMLRLTIPLSTPDTQKQRAPRSKRRSR